MGVSAIQEQRETILSSLRSITRGNWKVLIIDENTKAILDNVVKEDEILNENITNIEQIELRRDLQQDTDAIYFLSPLPHIVDCLLADLERHRYQSSHLVWIALLDPQLRRRIDSSSNAQKQLVGFETLSVDFFPRESHLVTFRDPWSFEILFNENCNDLVASHLQSLAQKITGICVSLGELPKVRYYRPRNPSHAAAVLCSHLARFVSEELDAYARWNTNFPPPSTRPQGVLLITDRSMDLNAPLLHEFTYQAMAHDLLPINNSEQATYRSVINQGQPDEEEKEMEIVEKDKIWVDYRHKHMMTTLNSIPVEFNKFKADNPHFFADQSSATNISAIKSMVVGLSQFQEQKEQYSLHLNMVEELMRIFEEQKLMDMVLLELQLATGLDESLKKAKGLAQEVVRQLDSESTTPADRLRLIMLYLVYRTEGVIEEDIQRLLAHSQLPAHQTEVILNQLHLGAKILKQSLKSPSASAQQSTQSFPHKTAPVREEDAVEWASSRYEPQVKLMLEELAKNTLDQSIFPYHKPQADDLEPGQMQTQASLRSAKPTWARNRMSTLESRQRVIVFIAGGATFSESRACYESSKTSGKDVFLATSHMVTPSLYVRQVADLSKPRKQLDLPIDRPKKKAPDFLFMRNDPPPPPAPKALPVPPQQLQQIIPGGGSGQPPRVPAPPTQQMANVSLGSGGGRPSTQQTSNGTVGSGKLEKEKPDKEKKKRNMFGIRK